jgi:predicted TIM-barrel fold metal-dependent hydrolase
MIIDAHAHIFQNVHGLTQQGPTQGVGYGRIRMGGETSQLIPPYNHETCFTSEMLLANLDWAGIDRAILLQGPFYGGNNSYVLEAIHKYPDRLTGVAFLDPWKEDAPDQFDLILKSSRFRGIKLECSITTGLIGIHPGARLDGPELAWLWQALEVENMVLVLDLGGIGTTSYQTGAVREIALHHPGLKIVIAHLGQPKPEMEYSTEIYEAWLDQVDLGLLPNVWLDCAALPVYYPDEEYPFPSAGKVLQIAFERIGSNKIIWGSDQPGLLVRASLPQLIRMFRSEIRFLTQTEQNLVLGETAGQIFW